MKRFLFALLISFSWVQGNAQYQQKEQPFRIAILACIREYEPIPSLQGYIDLHPDMALWIGDNIYADTENDPQVISDGYTQLASYSTFQQLKSSTPFYATWDDHDYGNNNENRHYPIKAESKKIFREFWELEDLIKPDQDGIYYSFFKEVDGKKVQFIMLDTRYNLDEVSADGTGDVLGENQWKWFESEIKKEFDLRFIISGFQILLNKETGSETWDYFPIAKQRLFDIIKKNGTENVIFIAGDQHYGEVNRHYGALDYDAIELQFAGVNQIENPEKNIYRVSSVAGSKHSVAYIDLYINGTETDVPHLQFTIQGFEHGQNEVSYRVPLSELKKNITINGHRKFGEATMVSFSHRFHHLDAHFTLDGSDPTKESELYLEPFEVKSTTTLKVALFDKLGNQRSEIHNVVFEKLFPISSIDAPVNLVSGLTFHYVEGEYKLLPNFDQEIVLKSGLTNSFNPVEIAERDDHFAIQFKGYIEIESTGLYTFQTSSDDGSKLYIGNKMVVDNDGSHSARTRSGLIALEAGLHPIRLDYFEDYSGQSLKVSYNKQGEEPTVVSFEQLKTTSN